MGAGRDRPVDRRPTALRRPHHGLPHGKERHEAAGRLLRPGPGVLLCYNIWRIYHFTISFTSFSLFQMVGMVHVLMKKNRETSYIAVRDTELCLNPSQTLRIL